jgi:hypothetical protein
MEPFRMPMQQQANQKTIGGKRLFYFESLNTKTETSCLILAHGSISDNTTFCVPAGKQVNFYSEDFEATRPYFKGNRSIKGVIQQTHETAVVNRDEATYKYDQNKECKNYTLSKLVGRHEFGRKKLKDSDTTYKDINTYMLQASKSMRKGALPMWSPHVVTIRNRFYSSGVTLKWLINTVLAHNSTITNFYVAACRVNFIGSERVDHASDKEYEVHKAKK